MLEEHTDQTNPADESTGTSAPPDPAAPATGSDTAGSETVPADTSEARAPATRATRTRTARKSTAKKAVEPSAGDTPVDAGQAPVPDPAAPAKKTAAKRTAKKTTSRPTKKAAAAPVPADAASQAASDGSAIVDPAAPEAAGAPVPLFQAPEAPAPAKRASRRTTKKSVPAGDKGDTGGLGATSGEPDGTGVTASGESAEGSAGESAGAAPTKRSTAKKTAKRSPRAAKKTSAGSSAAAGSGEPAGTGAAATDSTDSTDDAAATVAAAPAALEVDAEVDGDLEGVDTVDTAAREDGVAEETTESSADDSEDSDDSDEAEDSDDSDDDAEDSDENREGSPRRRRRRGGRRRRKGSGGGNGSGADGNDSGGDRDERASNDADQDEQGEGRQQGQGGRGGKGGRGNQNGQSSQNKSSQTKSGDDADSSADQDGATGPSEGEDRSGGDGDSNTSRRRRRRRRSGEGGDDGGDDPENTVTRVRKARSAEDEITSFSGSTRLEAKKQRRREGREAGRRRAPIISEAEFLARREAVDRTMVIRQRADLTQIAVLEDKVLVEHYVARESQTSLIGNVYLGRVQNVLPSMEAAFVDIGKGRNAVLYAGEVNWEALGAKEGNQRKIEQVLKPGQPVLVQVSKDPIGHKGARLTSQISLPGRFLVYVPAGSTSGISRKLPEGERNRLKTLLKEIVPDTAGVIVRTAAEGASEDELTHDVARLKARWEDIEKKVESSKSGKSPELLYGEPDLTLKVVRDLFTEDFAKLVVSGDQAWEMVQSYVDQVAPDLADRLERHDDSAVDAFSDHRIDEQIAKALERKVWLPSGGSLVIDRTEAMTVVDVNTGKFTGSGGNLEETVTKNNLEAAEEIVRQLRLRDIGGIIVVDFIDMVLESNRDLVLRRLIECLGRDRTRHQVAEVTSLGLVQMTRKRIGTGLLEAFSESCEHCNGRGLVLHPEPVESRRKPADDEPRKGRRSRGRGRDDDDNGSSSSSGGSGNGSSGSRSGSGGRDQRGDGSRSGSGRDDSEGSAQTPRRPTPAEFAAMARAEKAERDADDTAPASEDSGGSGNGDQSSVSSPQVSQPQDTPSDDAGTSPAPGAPVTTPAEVGAVTEAAPEALDGTLDEAVTGAAPGAGPGSTPDSVTDTVPAPGGTSSDVPTTAETTAETTPESAPETAPVAPPAPPAAPRIVTSTRRIGARRAAGPPAGSTVPATDGSAAGASSEAPEGSEGGESSTAHVPVKKKGTRKR